VLPLYDDNPTRTPAYVNNALIAVNILVFLYELSLSPRQLEGFFHLAAVIPHDLTATFAGEPVSHGIPEWATLITSQFLHGGLLHIGGNMLYLWVFGNNIEDRLGHVKYLIFYLTCGVLAALTQWFFSQSSTVASLGASGAIAGVLGAYILRFPSANVFTLIFLGIFITTARISALIIIGLFFVQNALAGFASLSAPATIGMDKGGVAYFAHLGGFIFGLILGPLFGLFGRTNRDF
jgi:membrane associated rhomboid family serine protease